MNYIRCDKYVFRLPNDGMVEGAIGFQNGTGQNADGEWLTRVTSTQVVSNTSEPKRPPDDRTEVITVNIGTFPWNKTWDFDTAERMMSTAFKTTQCTLGWCLKKYVDVSVVSK